MFKKEQLAALVMLLTVTSGAASHSNSAASPAAIERETLCAEIYQFLREQIAAHVQAIPSLDPAPGRVLGAGATGEYTWGTFMRALGAYAEMSRQPSLGGRNLAELAAQIGLLEHRLGSTRFSQLYAAQTLRHGLRHTAPAPA